MGRWGLLCLPERCAGPVVLLLLLPCVQRVYICTCTDAACLYNTHPHVVACCGLLLTVCLTCKTYIALADVAQITATPALHAMHVAGCVVRALPNHLHAHSCVLHIHQLGCWHVIRINSHHHPCVRCPGVCTAVHGCVLLDSFVVVQECSTRVQTHAETSVHCQRVPATHAHALEMLDVCRRPTAAAIALCLV